LPEKGISRILVVMQHIMKRYDQSILKLSNDSIAAKMSWESRRFFVRWDTRRKKDCTGAGSSFYAGTHSAGTRLLLLWSRSYTLPQICEDSFLLNNHYRGTIDTADV
jgi:hypothetical protein